VKNEEKKLNCGELVKDNIEFVEDLQFKLEV